MKIIRYIPWILLGIVPIVFCIAQHLIYHTSYWAFILWGLLEITWITLVISYKAERDEKRKAKQ